MGWIIIWGGPLLHGMDYYMGGSFITWDGLLHGMDYYMGVSVSLFYKRSHDSILLGITWGVVLSPPPGSDVGSHVS
ncbi:hypothetical protein FKM82_023716 [Ascaphus truei]